MKHTLTQSSETLDEQWGVRCLAQGHFSHGCGHRRAVLNHFPRPHFSYWVGDRTGNPLKAEALLSRPRLPEAIRRDWWGWDIRGNPRAVGGYWCFGCPQSPSVSDSLCEWVRHGQWGLSNGQSSAGLDTSPLVFFWLVVVLSNCVQWYFAYFSNAYLSFAISITRCQTLQLSRCGNVNRGQINAQAKPVQ